MKPTKYNYYIRLLLNTFLIFLFFTSSANAIEIYPGDDKYICSSATVTLGDDPTVIESTTSGNYVLEWRVVGGAIFSFDPNPEVSPTETTTYELILIDIGLATECTATVTVYVGELNDIRFESLQTNQSFSSTLSDDHILRSCILYKFTANPSVIGSGSTLRYEVLEFGTFISTVLASGAGNEFQYMFDVATPISAQIRFWCDENSNNEFNGGEATITKSINIVHMSVSIQDNSNQGLTLYGFDNWTNNLSNLASLAYEPLSNLGDFSGTSWKSVKTNDTDAFELSISMSSTFSGTQFQSTNSNIVVSPPGIVASQTGTNTIYVQGDNVENFDFNTDINVLDNCGKLLDHLNIVTYQEVTKKAAIIKVNEASNPNDPNDNGYIPTLDSDLNMTDIQSWLDGIYKQAVVTIDAFGIYTINVDYDHDNDGELDMWQTALPSSEGYWSDEMTTIKEHILANPVEPSVTFDFYIFLVQNPRPNLPLYNLTIQKGMMYWNQPYGFVNTSTEPDIVAHEIGHGLGLEHPNNTDGICIQHPPDWIFYDHFSYDDNDNIMSYCNSANSNNITDTKLRKFQWDCIRGIVCPE